ncbi:hypothetical protein BBJ28_00003448 [Nothophytophthora sp. Chile5]|nr:hypothetical protein BBJ28_00003448 [Nothophytophthora sp. Chile5]
MPLALEASESNLRDERGCDRALPAAGALSNLAEMEGLVREMRPKYLRPKTFIRTKGAKLSEQDKDEFDAVSKRSGSRSKHAKRSDGNRRMLRVDLDVLEQKVARAKEEKKKLAVSLLLLQCQWLMHRHQSQRCGSVVQRNRGSRSQQLKYVPQNSGGHPDLYRFDLTKDSCCFVSVQEVPMFASQSEELEFTEEEDRRFRVENVMLHRHFQENLEDAK